MEAPDKIYVPKEYTDNSITPIGVTTKPVFPNDVCYIRKDALLEWLENKTKELPDSFVNGLTYLAYKEVIDKLKSM